MDEDIEVAIRTLIDLLDEKMQEKPSQEIADISNYLEEVLKKS